MKRTVGLPVLLAGLLLLAACAPKVPSTDAEAAHQVALDYYTALNAKGYRTMYGLISDGFKQLEPTARDYPTFEAYISKFYDTATGIRVTSSEVAYASPTEVGVNYVAVIMLKGGTEKELKSTFTVKKKPNGWKLIHPYGQNIDAS